MAIFDYAHRLEVPAHREVAELPVRLEVPEEIQAELKARKGGPPKPLASLAERVAGTPAARSSARLRELVVRAVQKLEGHVDLEAWAVGDPHEAELEMQMMHSGPVRIAGSEVTPSLAPLDPATVTVPCTCEGGEAGTRRQRRFLLRWVLHLEVPKVATSYRVYMRRDVVTVETACRHTG